MAKTHAELVEDAASWLKNTCRCGWVVKEYRSYANENPDAFGMTSMGSFLVECKATRSDFLADAKKFPRTHPGHCMGDYRFYFANPGIIDPEELPEGWGLVEAGEKRHRVIRWAAGYRPRWERDIEPRLVLGFGGICNERKLMYSIIRRIALRGLLEVAQEPAAALARGEKEGN